MSQEVPHLSLQENIRQIILRRLVRGEVLPGDPIDETALAKHIGEDLPVVQTALADLTECGFLQTGSGAGFSITPLTVREAEDIYQILGDLEALALRLAGAPPKPKIHQLEVLNHQLLAASDLPEKLVDLDTQWHAMLLEDCPNKRLLELIACLKDVVVRYEYSYMRNFGMVAGSARVHARVLKELEQGTVEAAAGWLEVNWHDGIKALAKWLA